ncbi:MAG TPA: pantoate--beta-alanine ligase [Candidatus Dormibacteraeota bacterium]|nr:pantoate--beta-alanine ligase [Candidatus Dormibacteraeota bacterium]
MSRPAAMRELSRRARRSGESIGFVPTMGALHAGHLSLMRRARRENRRLAVSVFVNPLQFGPHEDFARYPRNELQDLRLTREEGCDWLFMPSPRNIYPPGFATRVVPGPIGDQWEGAARPGHFGGVLTVVLKLLEMVEPDTIYLGQKDAQQVALVAQMVRDLDLPVRVVVCPTVRERDGLALSSRNVLLSASERERARGIVVALRAGKRAARAGRRDAGAIVAETRRSLVRAAAPDRIDYVGLVDPRSFEPVPRLTRRALLIAAVRIGKTRLIDNMPIVAPGGGR